MYQNVTMAEGSSPSKFVRSSMNKHTDNNMNTSYTQVKKKSSFMNDSRGSKLIQESPYATTESNDGFNPMNGSIYRKHIAPSPGN